MKCKIQGDLQDGKKHHLNDPILPQWPIPARAIAVQFFTLQLALLLQCRDTEVGSIVQRVKQMGTACARLQSANTLAWTPTRSKLRAGGRVELTFPTHASFSFFLCCVPCEFSPRTVETRYTYVFPQKTFTDYFE